MNTVWDDLERSLVDIYSMPHNRTQLRNKDLTPQIAANNKVQEVKSGLANPIRKTYRGPMVFLRVVGSVNRVYGGEWWFDVSTLDSLEAAYSKIYITSSNKNRAVRDMLRELLAISNEWNRISEVAGP